MKKLFFLIAFSAVMQMSSNAQRFKAGNSVSFYMPVDELEELFDPGYGFDFIADIHIIGGLSATGRFGWFKMHGKSLDGNDIDDLSLWNGAIGAKFRFLRILYIEGRATYLFPDDGDSELGFTPAAGVRLKNFDINLGYHLGDYLNYFEVRLGIYWIGKNNQNE